MKSKGWARIPESKHNNLLRCKYTSKNTRTWRKQVLFCNYLKEYVR